MPKYVLTNKAVNDLSDIWNYTYEAWSENQADKYYEILIDSCKQISENPEKGKSYDEIDATIFGFKVGKHIIFYRSVKANQIEVVRILHARMDLKNKLEE